jgi:hypothetical protein
MFAFARSCLSYFGPMIFRSHVLVLDNRGKGRTQLKWWRRIGEQENNSTKTGAGGNLVDPEKLTL